MIEPNLVIKEVTEYFDNVAKNIDAMNNDEINAPDNYTQELIIQECDAIKEMLLEKNRKYGNSALTPCRIFSTADPVEQINVRIDDKLSRVKSGQTDDTEDVEKDLIGYLLLKRVALKLNIGEKEND